MGRKVSVTHVQADAGAPDRSQRIAELLAMGVERLLARRAGRVDLSADLRVTTGHPPSRKEPE
ncbi:MAG: hypothetical protein WEC75_00255 [Dehalococcoidia bacterium]